MEVCLSSGELAGTVEQQWSIFKPKFLVRNTFGQALLQIEGPICTCSAKCGKVKFRVDLQNST